MTPSPEILGELSSDTLTGSRSGQPRWVVVHRGALGDLILTLPALDGLARVIPGLRMDFWGRPQLLALLATKPYRGRVFSCDGSELTPFFSDDSTSDAPVPHFLRDASGLLIFGQESSRTLADRLRQRLDCPVVWVRSFPDRAQPTAVADFQVSQLRAAGWPISTGLPTLNPSAEELRLVDAWFEKRGWSGCGAPVMVHPGSGGRSKIWPLQLWWHLLLWLQKDRNVPVLLAIGPADEVLRPLVASAERAGVELIDGASLPRLAALIHRCRLFVGNDSGVTHLAAALRIPTIAVFGPTSPDVWGPRGRHVQIIQSRWKQSQAFTFDPDEAASGLEAPVQAAVEKALAG